MMNDTYTRDGGTWGFPVRYQDIVHFIVPKNFTTMQNIFEKDDKNHQLQIDTVLKQFDSDGIMYERKTNSISVKQDINLLSDELRALEIPHRKTEHIIEIKLY